VSADRGEMKRPEDFLSRAALPPHTTGRTRSKHHHRRYGRSRSHKLHAVSLDSKYLVSHSEINAPDFIIVGQFTRVAVTNDATMFQHVDLLCDCERAAGILLHQ